MRFRRRADSNQAAVVAALRGIGATVVSLHEVGGGVPDLLVGYRGFTILVEVKGSKSASSAKTGGGKKTTPRQMAWHQAWRGSTVVVVHSVDEAVAFFNGDLMEAWSVKNARAEKLL